MENTSVGLHAYQLPLEIRCCVKMVLGNLILPLKVVGTYFILKLHQRLDIYCLWY